MRFYGETELIPQRPACNV